MAIRVQILPKKTFDDGSVRSVSGGLSVCPPWWSTSNEHHFAQSTLPQDISLKVETPSRLYHRAKHFDLQLPDREPTSVQSIGETHREVGLDDSAANSLCNALESGLDKSRENDIERQAKPVFSVNNPNALFGLSHQNYYHSMDCARHPYADAYFSGLFTPYGPQVIAQLGGGAPTRIPLPLDLAEDEPIYVNAKQYHGILRRRKCRAKLEAQNKLVKTRKPYLHESRHIHALRRVRGSGGRFLSKKKLQQPDVNCTNRMNGRSELESHCSRAAGSSTNCSDISSVSINDSNFQLQGHRYSDINPRAGSMRDGIRYATSTVGTSTVQ